MNGENGAGEPISATRNSAFRKGEKEDDERRRAALESFPPARTSAGEETGGKVAKLCARRSENMGKIAKQIGVLN